MGIDVVIKQFKPLKNFVLKVDISLEFYVCWAKETDKHSGRQLDTQTNKQDLRKWQKQKGTDRYPI